MPRTSTKTTARKSTRKAAVTRLKTVKATAQETAANAVSTALADVSRVVGVTFNNSAHQIYSYHTRDASLKIGDYAVVASPHGGTSGFHIPELNGYLQIVKIVEVKETVHSINAASKWILGKLDLAAAFEEAQRREQIAVLEAKIKKARKEAEERVKLEQLRELSPELDTLITQYDALRR